MSEFIKRLQDRLKESRKGSKAPLKQSASLSANLDSFGLGRNSAASLMACFSPSSITKVLTYSLMLACAISATYWLMRLIQIPGTPSQPSNGISKGLTLYSNQDANSAYGLFGSKPLVTENIYLRGVVATSKNPDGTLDGFAIFEIDGKPTNAISVGETMGKGLSLLSIGDEQATLLYQGQKLNFKLSKQTKDKVDKNSAKDTASKK